MLLSERKPVRVYRRATVVDGTGANRFLADVAVEGARIVAVHRAGEELVLPASAVEIDAAGLVLAPGLIDVRAHDHMDRSHEPTRDAGILRGITTLMLGQVGLAEAATAGNTAVLVPHDRLRDEVVGGEDRAATPAERTRMAEALGRAMDAGAFGMSSGLVGEPGVHADAEELEALCRVVAERGGLWLPLGRASGPRALDACAEALGIARRSGCSIHIPRATVRAVAQGGRLVELLALIDEAVAAGIDATVEDGGHLREDAVQTLEEAVRRRSGAPAERLGLDRGDAPRGVIRAGAAADLVLFDPDRAAAGVDDPFGAPAGIVEVVVAGVPVVVEGAATGETPGGMLRKPPPAHRAAVPRVDAVIDADAPAFRWTPRTPVVAPPELAGVAAWLRGADDADHAQAPITLAIDEALAAAADVRGRVADEAFRVEVSAAGVTISGATPAGAFRGATVLRQLREPERHADEDARLPAGVWKGAPAHGWRGVMLDVARHFRPLADVRRLVDLLADHHLNVLHLHLTDDQGWRFEVPGYPRLVEVGARREATQLGHGPLATVEPGLHEGHYSRDDLRDLVAYARERFVTVVPEVELPGHVQAALAAYPELGNLDAAEPPTGPWERFGVNPRTLAPTEAALEFGRAAIDALCDAFDAEWIGIGGDEVPVTEWAASPSAAARMRELGLARPEDVQPWFTAHFVAHVRSRGRTALAWDEVLEGDVPEGVRVLAWRGPVAMREALRRGIPVVACPDLEAYLDYPQSDSADEPIRVGPPLTLERAYSLRVEEGAVGGQANVWTEHLPTRDRLDFAMFPRLAAIAERLWEGGDPASFADFERRLPVHLRRLAASGVAYRPLDGPTPAQRRPGIPGKPLTVAGREQIVAGLVARLVAEAEKPHADAPK